MAAFDPITSKLLRTSMYLLGWLALAAVAPPLAGLVLLGAVGWMLARASGRKSRRRVVVQKTGIRQRIVTFEPDPSPIDPWSRESGEDSQPTNDDDLGLFPGRHRG